MAEEQDSIPERALEQTRVSARPDDDVPPLANSPVPAVAFGGVVLATLGLVILPFTLLPFLESPTFPIDPDKTSLADLFVLLSTLAGLGLSLLLFVASVGCFKRKPWARRGMILYAVASVVLGVAGAAVYWLWLSPRHRFAAAPLRGPGPLGSFAAWGIGSVFGLCVLYFMTRPRVKRDFFRT